MGSKTLSSGVFNSPEQVVQFLLCTWSLTCQRTCWWILESLSKRRFCQHGRQPEVNRVVIDGEWWRQPFSFEITNVKAEWLPLLISNENGWRHHSPSITARFTSGWRPCWQKRRLLKLSNILDALKDHGTCRRLFSTGSITLTSNRLETFSVLASSMDSYMGAGSDVTNRKSQTGSDVITVISCRFTACFPTGSDVITPEVTS